MGMPSLPTFHLTLLTTAIIQSSWAEKSHLPYFKQSPLYEISALQNTSIASSKAAAEKFTLTDVATYGDIDSLLSDSNIDLVLISVKVPSHRSLIKPALQAGKNIFCEWPLARNLKEAEELAALAKQHNVRTMVGLQARQNSAIRKAKAMIDAGELGEIVASTMTGTGGLFGPGLLTEYYAYTCDVENGANNLTIACAHAVFVNPFPFSCPLWLAALGSYTNMHCTVETQCVSS